MNEEAFLQQIVDDPANAATTWLVLADWLEERGDPRAELVRLIHAPNFRSEKSAEEHDRRVCELLASGIQPYLLIFTNSIGMRFVLIPAGSFLMGSPANEAERHDDEGPQHEVEITLPFYLGIYPVTKKQHAQVIGD